MAQRAEQTDRIVDAALRLAAERGWRRTTIADIAAASGAELAEVYDALDARGAVWDLLIDRVDAQVLAGAAYDREEESRRDILFDLLMRRFDALTPHKAAVESVLRELPLDPLTAACSGTRLLRSMRWMLEAAGVPAVGAVGALRAKLLLGVYLSTLRVWLRDDTADLSRTMAALDRRLRRAERILGAR